MGLTGSEHNNQLLTLKHIFLFQATRCDCFQNNHLVIYMKFCPRKSSIAVEEQCFPCPLPGLWYNLVVVAGTAALAGTAANRSHRGSFGSAGGRLWLLFICTGRGGTKDMGATRSLNLPITQVGRLASSRSMK